MLSDSHYPSALARGTNPFKIAVFHPTKSTVQTTLTATIYGGIVMLVLLPDVEYRHEVSLLWLYRF